VDFTFRSANKTLDSSIQNNSGTSFAILLYLMSKRKDEIEELV
jgi:hypothetical protein